MRPTFDGLIADSEKLRAESRKLREQSKNSVADAQETVDHSRQLAEKLIQKEKSERKAQE